MSRCLGCGIETDKDYCERCFKIRNYGINVPRDIDAFDLKTDDGTIVLVLDALFLPSKLSIKKDVLVVVNKRDLVPDISDQRIIDYVSSYDIKPIDIIVVSTFKNYNYDLLYESLKKLKTKKLYFVGTTKSGKTAMINKLLYDYQNVKNKALSSEIPNITSSLMDYKLGNIELIDTPSIKDSTIISNVDDKLLKVITPLKMKQVVYQAPKDINIFNINNIISVMTTKSSLVFYFNDKVLIKRDKDVINGTKYEFDLNRGQDLVINNMGYIRVNNKTKITLITYNNVNIFIRQSIGSEQK
jgi:ribosome biogenesis GTPase A